MYEWNKPYQMVMKIKNDYVETFGKLDTLNFNIWVEKLDKEEYNEFMEPLQTTQLNELLLIRYGLAELQEGMWTDKNSIYRQCRSVVIDLTHEKIVLSPFRKFFNLGEVEENSIDNITEMIKNSKSIEISDKLDGSMQSFRFYNGQYIMSGSKSLSRDQSWRLDEGYNMLTEDHKLMAKEFDNITFVFEYISLKDAHVVVYDKSQEGLYLIGMIDVRTVLEYPYWMIRQTANYYNIKCSDIENYTFDEILELSKTTKSNEKEGWVINIDGHKVKIKCDDYVKLHRILDKVSSINVIIQAIGDDTYDDLISKVPDSYRPRVERISSKIFDWLKDSEMYIQEMYDFAPKNSKKDFMIYIDKNVEKKFRGYVRSKYLNKDYNLIKSKHGSYKQIKDILGKNVDYSALFFEEGAKEK